jgi:hypothetical protein
MLQKTAKPKTRKEVLIELDRELTGAYYTIVGICNRLVDEIEDILRHILGENLVLECRWEWEWYRNGPTIFLKLNGSNKDRLGGVDKDIAMDLGYTPLSNTLSRQLGNIGMSWCHVKVFGYEYYMNKEDTDTFVEEFQKLINSQVRMKEEHV